ncbi:MAG TPA: endospore germination permease [Thermoclostridium caenicola]|nr:endospore germination permease [Thermoclostridium caenicola]
MGKTRISGLQLFMLLSGFLFGSTVILAPALGAKNDAWLAIIIGGTGGALLMLIYAAISLLNPSKTLVEILKEKMGKVLGSIIAVLYIWYFIHLASLVFRDFGEFICTVTFPETPMTVLISIFALGVVYGVNGGVEVMGRMGELLVPIIPTFILIVSVSLITVNDFTAFLPVLENGMGPVLKAALSYITFPFGETVAFLMLFPNLNRKEKLKKIVFVSAALSALISIVIFFRDISVLGSDLMSRVTFVPHSTTLLFPEANVEPLVDINLMIGGEAKIGVCIYAATKAISQVAGIENYTNLTRAVGAFCVVLSVWDFENVLDLFSWTERIYSYYAITFQVIIPLILLVLSLIKRSKPAEGSDADNEGVIASK